MEESRNAICLSLDFGKNAGNVNSIQNLNDIRVETINYGLNDGQSNNYFKKNLLF